MATKTTKKTTVKPVAAKKTVTKKTTAKKTTTRATSVKPAPKAVKTPKATTPCMEHIHECKCGANCHCGDNCQCGAKCKCGGKFGRIVKKLIIALILLALGFAAAKLCCCDKGMRGPRVQFADNGCMVEETVKCPKLLELLPAMDINQDGCITREEYREIKHQLRNASQPQPVDTEPTVDAE